MDLNMNSFLCLFFIFGSCTGQGLLPDGPVEAVNKKNATFETLVDLTGDFIKFTWSFNRGSRLVPIITMTPAGEAVAEGYRGRVLVNRTNGFLTLGKVEANDRGYYRATLRTSKFTKTEETVLRVLGCCEWYALPEGPVDVISGEKVIFKTLIGPKEMLKAIVWFFNNGSELRRVVTVSEQRETFVSEGYLGRVEVNHTNGFLTLCSLSVKDNGDYFVNLWTTKGLMTGDTKVQVLEPVTNVIIRANVSETVQPNSTVVLVCSAKGSLLKFSWTIGNKTITRNKTQLTIKEEAKSSTLTISSIQPSDLDGPIYCTATNQLGEERSAPYKLTVLRKPKTSWSVSFRALDLCTLKGSSAQFRCSYDYPDGETVYKTEWFKGENKVGRWKRTGLSSLSSYQNRVKYLGDQEHDCSLEISDLQDSDAGHYYFRFDTYKYGRRSIGSIYLSLTGLTARVKPNRVKEGENVTLTCDTSCQLSGLTRFVWFRNGHLVDKPAQFQARAEDAGSYTCAVEGQELLHSNHVFLDVKYAPVNVSVEVSQTGKLAEGSSLNLTCRGAGNPAVIGYSWYKRTGSSSLLQVGPGQVLSLQSLERSHAGLYICRARNLVGENNSSEVLLEIDVTESSPPASEKTLPSDLPFTADLPEMEEEMGELRGASPHAVSPHTTTPSHTTSSYTTMPSHTTTSSHTTLSSYTTSPSHDTTQRHRETRQDNQDILDFQCVRIDKMQLELKELRLSFETSLRQMEIRTHSLLRSMSRRMERIMESMNSGRSHQPKPFVSLLSSGISPVTPGQPD